MIFDSDPTVYFRPSLVALRGGAITLIAFLFFFFMSGVDRMMYAQPYLGAVGLLFVLHYAIAWFTVRRLRRRYVERQGVNRGAKGPQG